MIVMFVLLEFRVKAEILALYFNYLDWPIGKGLYLLMIGLMIAEVQSITEAIFCVIISLLGLFNIALGITYEIIDFDPNEPESQSQLTQSETQQ